MESNKRVLEEHKLIAHCSGLSRSLTYTHIRLHHFRLSESLPGCLSSKARDQTLHDFSIIMYFYWPGRVTVNREHRLHSYYLRYQHVVVVTCRSAVCDAEHSLKSVISISKHLTLEWWLLAGAKPCCLSSLQARKMTERLSDMYSTASSQWARSHYTWLL